MAGGLVLVRRRWEWAEGTNMGNREKRKETSNHESQTETPLAGVIVFPFLDSLVAVQVEGVQSYPVESFRTGEGHEGEARTQLFATEVNSDPVYYCHALLW